MEITVRLFSLAKELAGTDRVIISLDKPTNAGGIMDRLVERVPGLAPWKASVRLAVNLEYVPTGHPVQEGDEVAIIPPVSGG